MAKALLFGRIGILHQLLFPGELFKRCHLPPTSGWPRAEAAIPLDLALPLASGRFASQDVLVPLHLAECHVASQSVEHSNGGYGGHQHLHSNCSEPQSPVHRDQKTWRDEGCKRCKIPRRVS